MKKATLPHVFMFLFISYFIVTILLKKIYSKVGIEKNDIKGDGHIGGAYRREGSNLLHTMPMKASSKLIKKLPHLKRSRCDNDVDHFQIEN